MPYSARVHYVSPVPVYCPSGSRGAACCAPTGCLPLLVMYLCNRPLTRIIHQIAVASCKSLFETVHVRNRPYNDFKQTAMRQDTHIVSRRQRHPPPTLRNDLGRGRAPYAKRRAPQPVPIKPRGGHNRVGCSVRLRCLMTVSRSVVWGPIWRPLATAGLLRCCRGGGARWTIISAWTYILPHGVAG
jgi:hypothetical protein